MINQMAAGMAEARPPYVRFEVRAIEKRKPNTEGAAVYYVDKIFALVTPHGSKDTVEKIVEEWFPVLQEEVRQGRFPQHWLNAYKEAYEAFKAGQEPPLNGIAIRSWPVTTPAETKLLLNLRVFTVEDLAAANEELISRLGMGGRNLVQKAKDYLQAAKGTGPLIAQLEAMRQTVFGLETRLGALQERNAKLEAQLDFARTHVAEAASAGQPPMTLGDLDDRLAQARASAPRGPSDDALIDDAIAEA